jgi:hypothetical protein
MNFFLSKSPEKSQDNKITNSEVMSVFVKEVHKFSLLTSALDGGEQAASSLGRFIPRDEQ